MNQKGIVISSLVYALLTFFLLLLAGLLSILWYRQNSINNLGIDANEIYEDTYVPDVLLNTQFLLNVGPNGTYEFKDNSYYFTGSNPNNWIAFGMVSSTNQTPLLWRIIKNGDEGIKIIYEGPQESTESPPTEDGKITLTDNYWDNISNKWNRPSSLNTSLQTWYDNLYVFLKSNYVQPINWCVGSIGLIDSTSEFSTYECIDQSLPSGEYDGFTTNQTPIGLINTSYYANTTSASCGDIDTTCFKDNNYLFKSNYSYWTMNAFANSDNEVWTIDITGAFSYKPANSPSVYIRPVINLSPDVIWVGGKGTLAEPYKIK